MGNSIKTQITMSILDKDYDIKLNMLTVTIKSEHPIPVSDFVKSMKALDHLYSQVVKSQKNIKRVRSEQPHELCIYSIDKCCIVINFIESNPVDGISCLTNIISVIINVIGLVCTVYESRKNTKLTEKLIEKEDEIIELEKERTELMKEGLLLSRKQLEELKDVNNLFEIIKSPGDSMFLSHSDTPQSMNMDYDKMNHLKITLKNLIKLGVRKHNKRKNK